TEAAGLLGSPLTTVPMTSREIAEAYPELIRAAEGPVMDTSAACMIRLAQAVRRNGFEVSLSGEGSDESLAGYVWFKVDRLVRLRGRPVYSVLRWLALSWLAGGGAAHRPPYAATAGMRTTQQFPYEMMAQSRERLYARDFWKALDGHSAYDLVHLPRERF